jgi:dihydroorotase
LGELNGSAGRLAVGAVADVCVFDPQAAWTVTPQALRSQGKNTPFSGYELLGRVRCTLIAGRVAFQI